MSYQGIDTAARITAAQAAKLKASGVAFVCRYLVPVTMWKALTPEEIDILRDNGLAILLCWEIGGADVKGGSAKGAQHGAEARQLADIFGVPKGTTIYFAVDYNIPTTDYIQCEQYLLAAKSALGGQYDAGLYGPERIVDFLSARGSCKKFWQCLAWSSKFLDVANVKQYKEQNSEEAKAMAEKCGILAVDLDACDDLRKAGMWMPNYNEYKEDDGGTIYEPQPNQPSQKQPWYAEAMAWAAENGIINDGRPKDNITRAEAATVAKRLYELCMREAKKEIMLHLPEDSSGGGLISE